jgi:carboxylesterase
MPDKNIASLGLFQAAEHQPFLWETDGPAVLLIHGFMGTPAQMRPLGEAFRQSGWSVQGLLLPGFGPELDTLFEQNLQDWKGSAESALLTLPARRRPVVLVGYSMGAAVALNIAAEHSVDGLILLAPFWRIGTPVQRLIWQVAKRMFRRPKPFKRANLADPRLREFFEGLLPELDLSDPATKSAIRQLRIPTTFVDQVFSLGKAAGKAAASVTSPTLIVQGMDDEAAKPAATRQLLQAMPGPVQYLELPSDHGVVQPDNPGFAGLSAAALHFASTLAAETQSL